MSLNATLARVTDRIVARSAPLRRPYLDRMARARDEGTARAHLSCGNQAHAYAAMPGEDKGRLAAATAGNLGIVTAYNDMLSAHQPYETFPALIRAAAREMGGTAQVAGGVPAMAITSREKSESSIPAWPWVTPSHMAGTPPATCAVPPISRAAARMSTGKVS